MALKNLLKAEIKKIVEERNKTNYSVDISLEIEGKPIHLVGIIGNLYDDILIMPLFGKLKNKHRVNAKIQHLVLCADGMKAETHIVSASEDIDPLKFDTAAKEMILELCTIYIKECNELIPFWWVEEYLDVHENDYINRLVGDLTDEEAEMKDRITKLLS